MLHEPCEAWAISLPNLAGGSVASSCEKLLVPLTVKCLLGRELEVRSTESSQRGPHGVGVSLLFFFLSRRRLTGNRGKRIVAVVVSVVV